MINSWVIETVINQPDAVRYAFKDLNNDGVDEMIVANPADRWKLLCDRSLLPQGAKPTLLAEGSSLDTGSAQCDDPLSGGEVLEVSWMSGTGRGVAVLSRIEKDASSCDQSPGRRSPSTWVRSE